MKRAGILGLAIVLTLGLAVAASHAAKAKKAKTEAEVEGVNFPEEVAFEFFGDVHSQRSKCEKGRQVTLVYHGPTAIADPVIGTSKTDPTGDWEVESNAVTLPEGNYAVEVKRKTIKKGDKELKCKGTTSPDKNFG